MKVLCRKRQRSELGNERCKAMVEEVARELEVGMTYTVYAQYVFEGCLMYLLDPYARYRQTFPRPYPAGLFEVVDSSIPSLWVFSYHPEREQYGIPAIWGYPEIVTSYEHFEGVLENKESVMMVWLRRRAEIDAE